MQFWLGVGAEPLWFAHNLVLIHVDGDDVDGTFGLAEVVGRTGDMPPLHVHHRDDEAFYLLEGCLALLLPGGRRIELEPGRHRP